MTKNKKNNVDAILLASGFSKRLGFDKLDVRFGKLTLFERTLFLLTNFGFNKVIVVTKREDLVNYCKKDGFVHVIKNSNANVGQSESIKLGANASTAPYMMFFNADQPFLTDQDITLIVDKAEDERIIIPTIDNKRGSPVIFAKKFKQEIMTLKKEEGGRVLFDKHKDQLKFVELTNKHAFFDIDTIDDLKGLNLQNKYL